MDDDTTLLLLNDAKVRIDLLTKQTNTQRKVIAELYEERDAAWAALLDYAHAMAAMNATCLAYEEMMGVPMEIFKNALRLAGQHEVAIAAARAGVKSNDK